MSYNLWKSNVDQHYKWRRTTTGSKPKELCLAVFDTVVWLSSRHRTNPKAGHLCRSLGSAVMRPKLQDPPGHRHPMTQCMERCSYQSQRTRLACTNCYSYKGVPDLKCLNTFMSIVSDGLASNHSLCTCSPPWLMPRGIGLLPWCVQPIGGPHSGSIGVRSGAASSDITGQWRSVMGCWRSMSALLRLSGQRSHKQEHTEIILTHKGCDETKPDQSP